MINSQFLYKIKNYNSRYGNKETLRRTIEIIFRSIFYNQLVIYSADLEHQIIEPLETMRIVIKEVSDSEQLNKDETFKLLNYWISDIKSKQIKERFSRGAKLWLSYYENAFAGFGWSIRGQTMEPYFFQLSKNEVHLFDYYIFEAYRGKGINPQLVNSILKVLKSDGCSRVFIETYTWNKPEIYSLQKTPFQKIGVTRRIQFGKKNGKGIIWTKSLKNIQN